MRQTHKEMRRAPRKKIRLKVRYWKEEFEGSGYTADASATGLFIETLKPPNAGDRLHLELALPEGPFFAEGVVARTVKAPRTVQRLVKSGFAIRFVPFGERLSPASASGAASATGALQIDLSDPVRLSTVFVNEIEKGGLFIPSDEKPSRGVTATVIVMLPKPHEPLQFTATVVQTTSKPAGVAVTFNDTDSRQRLAEITRELEAKGFRLLLDLTDPQKARQTLDTEIAHGGVFVPTASPPRRGALVRLTIGMPPPTAPMEAMATVMQVMDNPRGVGLQLDDSAALTTALRTALGA